MELYLSYLQCMALVQLCWIKHTVNHGWITRQAWVDQLTPLLGGPTNESVWYPILLEESTTMKQWTNSTLCSILSRLRHWDGVSWSSKGTSEYHGTSTGWCNDQR